MIDERAYELLCCQFGLANEGKAGLRKQVNELIVRLKAIEESNKENSKALVDTINDLKDSLEKQSTTVEHYRKEMELMRKYGLFCKAYKMVYYHYNNGGRSSDAAKLFLEYFMGTISTDGYAVYRMFDGEDSKVLHIGCWTHCRRLWVDALPSDRTAMDIIDPIGDMFRNEDLFRTMKLSGEQIKGKRRKLIGPILETCKAAT